MYIYSKSNRCLIRDIAVGWKLETTLIEGINSIIKLIVKRAPYISWMLLAARIAIKKIAVTTLLQMSSTSSWKNVCRITHRLRNYWSWTDR